MASTNHPPSLIEVLEGRSLANPIPREEFYRLRPQEIEPPFDTTLVKQAVRHFMAHHRPWLPYARPPEDYGIVWTATARDDGYQLMQEEPSGDPYFDALAWVDKVSHRVYEVLTGKRTLSPEDDGAVAELVKAQVDMFTEELDAYREWRTPIPGAVFDRWGELSVETQQRWMIAHYQVHPEDIGDLRGQAGEYIGCTVPDDHDPCAAPALILGEDVITFPIGLVEIIRNAGMLGDATLVLVRPQVALTFLQVWLDYHDTDVRIQLA